jgi:ABC-type sugar transport system substrate-binding protein
MNVTEDLLTAQPGISGIWVHDDTMCVGVVQAIKAMGFEGKNIAVVSYNGSKAGADMVRSGISSERPFSPWPRKARHH